MRNFDKKSTGRKIMESKIVLILLGILILFFAWSVLRFLNKMEETGRNKKVVEDKVAALREKQNKLEFDIKSLNTDEGKEEFFRENYGLAKVGEQVIVVVEAKESSKEAEKDSGGFFSFFKNWFK